jgi:hypothetical protein
MSRFKTALLAGVASIALAGAAAASVEIVPGTAGDTPEPGQVNDLLQPLFGVDSISGYFESSISGTGPYRYTFLGKEATFVDTFWVNGELLFNNQTTVAGTSVVRDFLNFEFRTPAGDVANGDANTNTSGSVNFFASCGPSGATPPPTDCSIVYLFLDDTGGSNSEGPDDDNHDDMVISIEMVSTVPLPAGFILLGTALGGLGVARRFRKS